MKLSIVIPVFNAEKTLQTTINCVRRQRFQDWELVLVDDGSTDGSLKICRVNSQEDKRIRVVHQENGGVASARNTGISEAKGDYIGFVDSDDLIADEMYYELLKIAEEKKVDIVQCSHTRTSDDLGKVNQKESEEVCDSIAALKRIYRTHYTNSLSLCTKIYRRQLFYNIRFTEGTAFEDDEIIPKLLYEAKQVAFVNKMWYCYVRNEGSIITAPREENINALTRILEDRMLWFKTIDDELYQLGRWHYFRYLRGKTHENVFRGTSVQELAIEKCKKYRNEMLREFNQYDRMALLLLCSNIKILVDWTVKTDFEPVQEWIRMIFYRK